MEKILVIEDNQAVQRALKRLFEAENYVVQAAPDRESAISMFHSSPPSAVILDLGLPGLPGCDVCREIKTEAPFLPIVVLSAKADIADKVLLLETGADDYVVKPFSPRELLARVRAVIRGARSGHLPDVGVFGGISVDFARMEVTCEDRSIALTAQEFRILKFFLENPRRVISRDELMHLLGYQNCLAPRTVDNHVSNMRRKLEKDPAHPVHFLTVRGAGYKFLP